MNDNINILVGATNEFGTITLPVNINVKGKKYYKLYKIT